MLRGTPEVVETPSYSLPRTPAGEALASSCLDQISEHLSGQSLQGAVTGLWESKTHGVGGDVAQRGVMIQV